MAFSLRNWIASIFEMDPRVREALRTGRKTWQTADGQTLALLSSDEELRMTPGERWARRNAERKAAGCRCGRPATHVAYNYSNVGEVPVEFWTCAEHVGVNVWVLGSDGWAPSERGVR